MRVQLSFPALVALLCWPGQAIPATPAEAAIDYVIVVTGGELLDGAYPDSHTHFLTRTLRPFGLHCAGSITSNDRRADILDALQFATRKARLIIVTGGLGPTDNDITRETLAEFTGIPLEEHAAALQTMEQRYGQPRAKLPANLRRQTLVPKGGDFLPNASGSAAGLIFETGANTIVALPGPPRELEPMVRDELVPRLKQRFGVHSPGCSLLVRFTGIGQSGVDQAIEQHLTLPENIILQSQFDGRRVDFTFILPHDRPEDRARLETLKGQLREHLGEYIYAFDNTTVEQVVLGQLRKQGKTLALAEVGSGGAVAASLQREPQAVEVVRGAFSAPTAAALARILHIPEAEWAKSAPGTERARLLTAAAARATGSDWAIAVGAAEETRPGDHSVCVTFLPPGGPDESLRMNLRGPADVARAGLVTQLLGELRQRLPTE